MTATLVDGGIAVVILGKGFDLPTDFAYHPQLLPISAADLPEERDVLGQKFPSTTKIVVIAGDLPSQLFGNLRTVLSRRSLTFVQRRNEEAVRDAISKLLPHKVIEPTPATGGNGSGVAINRMPEPKVIAPKPKFKGAINEFVRLHVDLNKGAAEEARRIHKLAIAEGISTTFGSLSQAISVMKRKGGRTGVPRSIMSEQAKALQTLDESIAGLQLIREYVEKTEATNTELTRRLDAFKQLLKD